MRCFFILTICFLSLLSGGCGKKKTKKSSVQSDTKPKQSTSGTDQIKPLKTDMSQAQKQQINKPEKGDVSKTDLKHTEVTQADKKQKSNKTGPYLEHVNSIRSRPWDENVILKFADWLEKSDPSRAELVRVQLKLAQLNYKDPQRKTLKASQQNLLKLNKSRWIKNLSALGESKVNASIEIGLIDEIRLEHATDDHIATLSTIPELRQLTMSFDKLTDKSFQLISTLPNLDRLTIEEGKVTESQLLSLEKLPPWTVIHIYSENFERVKLKAMSIRRVAKFNKLDAEQKRSATARFLSAINYSSYFGKPITVAGLGQAGITDTELQLLSGVPELESVYISESDVTSKGISHLAQFKKLKHLSLWDTKVDSIASLSGLTNLEELEIYPEYDTKMGDDGLEGLQNFTKLKKLYLNDDKISDITIRRLGGLTDLRKLELSVRHVKDEKSLDALSRLTKIENLSFSGGKLSDAVLKNLEGMKNLHTLIFNIDSGTGEGFQHLAGLQNLTYLSLGGKGVHDQGIQHLKSLEKLQTFMAQGSQISKSGAEKLAKELPHVTIILDKYVVKPPREYYRFHRQQLNKTTSLLIPAHWKSENDSSGNYISAREDGWDKVGGWSGDSVGPGEIQVYIDTESKSAKGAMMRTVKNNDHLKPKIARENIVQYHGTKEFASCIYQDESNRYLICAILTEKNIVVIEFQSPPSRFTDFEPLFMTVARSLRLGNFPSRHKKETIKISTNKMKEKVKSASDKKKAL